MPAKHWVSNYDEGSSAPFAAYAAAFIDTNVKGLRPLGCSKKPGECNKDHVYHQYLLNATPIVKVNLTKDIFLSSLVLPSGQESLRIRKIDQLPFGDGDEMGVESDPYFEPSQNHRDQYNHQEDVAPHSIVPKVRDWLNEQDDSNDHTPPHEGRKRKNENDGPSSLPSNDKSRKLVRRGGENRRSSLSSASISSSSHSN